MDREITYTLLLPDDARTDFSTEEKQMLRPIAETLAMLDGNAFFGHSLDGDREWYEQYLPEAWMIWSTNGGEKGWASGMGYVTEAKLRDESPMLKGLWEQYQTALMLTKDGENGR